MRILIVEDEEIQRISLQDDLQDAGYESTAVDSPFAALELLDKKPFDVVLTDLKMPGMDGITLLQRIKKLQPEAIVIVMTAYGTTESAQMAIKSGAYAYLTKPFSMDELLLLLEKGHGSA
ncbi:MAG: sigma-54-dependent transcriptional regulator [bacterium]